MSSWSEGTIPANGINIHYYRSENNRPPVVLLHGFTDSGLCWTPVAKDLERDYDVIMLDARGHGLSDGPVNGFSSQQLAADTVAAIKALEITWPFLLGHSMGAATAALVTADHPDLVRAVALEDPPWHSFDQNSQDAASEHRTGPDWSPWLTKLKAQTSAQRIAEGHEDNPAWSTEELLAWSTSKEQFNMDVLKSGPKFVPWREVIPHITCPALLITADPARGTITTPQDAHEIEQSWQHGRVIHIEGAGHNIRREQFATYIASIRAFFAEM